MRPVVAIVGRPNVGKSTLFNRLIGRRQAVVDSVAGVTRDRMMGEAEWLGRPFFVADTGGLLPEASSGMDASIRRQVEAALELAALVVFVVDVEVGITPLDEQIAAVVRASGRPVLIAANKADSEAKEHGAHDFARLGFGAVHAVSALHGHGTGDLLDLMVAALPPAPAGERGDELTRGIAVAIVGRPNVGKSSLVNRLLGEERMIVDDAPGTTRDAVDTPCFLDGHRFVLIDTAGLRRRTRIDTRTEFYAAVRAVQAIDRAQVAVLVLDSAQPFGRQDYRIAASIAAARKPAVLVFNKWDVVEKETMTSKRLEDAFREHAVELGYAPALFVSAQSGQRLHRLPGLLRAVHAESRRQWDRSILTRAIREAVARTPPPAPPRGRQEIRGAVQQGVDPIRIHVAATQPPHVPASYRRYLERQLRSALAIAHAPIELRIVRPRRQRQRPNPPEAEVAS